MHYICCQHYITIIIFSEQFVPIETQIFLLLDEVPCNSDPGYPNVLYGRPSGDWKGLKTNGVNLMMVLKPIENSNSIGIFSYLLDKIRSRKMSIDLCFPEDIAHLQLSRIYRCTKNIAEFYEEIVTHINKPDLTGRNYGLNSSSISYSPGHEIHGNHPEILLLARCNCADYCKIPVEHHLQENKTKILAMLKRIQSKFSVSKVTVLIDTSDDENCVNWLKTAVITENGTIGNIVFKTIGQCRGLEFPVLLSITLGSNANMDLTNARPGAFAPTTLDAWTRVTASLFIIQMDEENSAVTQGLKDCLKKQLAKQAEEQDEIKYNLLRKLYFFLQSPLFQWFLLISSIVGIIFGMFYLFISAFIKSIK